MNGYHRRERALRAYNAQRAEAQQSRDYLAQLAMQQARARDESLRLQWKQNAGWRRAKTEQVLTFFEANGFPFMQMLQVGIPKLFSPGDYRIINQPGWTLSSQETSYVEDVGGSNSSSHLLAGDNYYLASSRTGSSGRATAYTHSILSPEKVSDRVVLEAIERANYIATLITQQTTVTHPPLEQFR